MCIILSIPLRLCLHGLLIIEEGGRGVTDWEQGFVESCKEALESGRRLSEKQIKILERIYTERT